MPVQPLVLFPHRQLNPGLVQQGTGLFVRPVRFPQRRFGLGDVLVKLLGPSRDRGRVHEQLA